MHVSKVTWSRHQSADRNWLRVRHLPVNMPHFTDPRTKRCCTTWFQFVTVTIGLKATVYFYTPRWGLIIVLRGKREVGLWFSDAMLADVTCFLPWCFVSCTLVVCNIMCSKCYSAYRVWLCVIQLLFNVFCCFNHKINLAAYTLAVSQSLYRKGYFTIFHNLPFCLMTHTLIKHRSSEDINVQMEQHNNIIYKHFLMYGVIVNNKNVFNHNRSNENNALTKVKRQSIIWYWNI